MTTKQGIPSNYRYETTDNVAKCKIFVIIRILEFEDFCEFQKSGLSEIMPFH